MYTRLNIERGNISYISLSLCRFSLSNLKTSCYLSIIPWQKLLCVQITVSKRRTRAKASIRKQIPVAPALYKNTQNILYISMNSTKKQQSFSGLTSYWIILRSMGATSFSSLQLIIKSRYCIASRGRRPWIKELNKCEWVPCITSKHCSNTLNCCSLLSSIASINGNTSLSSSWKCSLLCSC